MKDYAVYIIAVIIVLWICDSTASKECETVPSEYIEICQARVRQYYRLKNRFHEECCENELKINSDSNCEECDPWASERAAQALDNETNAKPDEDSDGPVETSNRSSLSGSRWNAFRWSRRSQPTPERE